MEFKQIEGQYDESHIGVAWGHYFVKKYINKGKGDIPLATDGLNSCYAFAWADQVEYTVFLAHVSKPEEGEWIISHLKQITRRTFVVDKPLYRYFLMEGIAYSQQDQITDPPTKATMETLKNSIHRDLFVQKATSKKTGFVLENPFVCPHQNAGVAICGSLNPAKTTNNTAYKELSKMKGNNELGTNMLMMPGSEYLVVPPQGATFKPEIKPMNTLDLSGKN